MKKYIHNIFVKSAVALSIPLSVLLSAPVTQAYDVKSWGGANCQAYFGSDEANITKAASGLVNNANVYKWVSCGITRDKLFSNPSNIGTRAFWVYVRGPAGKSTRCHLRESAVNGANVQTRSAGRIGPGWINLDTSLSSTNGSRTLYCYVPPRGGITHIRGYEYTLTDGNS